MEQIFTAKEFQLYLNGLPKRYKSVYGKIQQKMATDLAQMIRNRAPSGQTGSLKTDIKEKKGNDGWKIVGPGHWSYVNAGVAPMKMLPIEFIREHIAFPGSTAGQKLTRRIPRESIDGWFYAGYTEGEGFVDRAIVSFENKIDKIINAGIAEVLKK